MLIKMPFSIVNLLRAFQFATCGAKTMTLRRRAAPTQQGTGQIHLLRVLNAFFTLQTPNTPNIDASPEKGDALAGKRALRGSKYRTNFS